MCTFAKFTSVTIIYQLLENSDEIHEQRNDMSFLSYFILVHSTWMRTVEVIFT